MARKTRLLAAAIAGIILTTAAMAGAQANKATTVQTGYAPVDGLKMYYEIHGAGQPLILLHGGLAATGMFDQIMPALSKEREVITLDLQAHGRTADIDRPMSYEALADDVAAAMHSLGIDRADVMGYSLGGGVALRVAIQHPELVKKLVLVSTPFSRDGWYPEIRAGMAQVGAGTAEQMKQTPMYQLYARIAPRPQDWPVLLTKTGDMMRKDYDWSREVQALRVPTLLVAGDADAVRTALVVEFFELLGGGKKDGGWDGSGISNARLAILPGLTHYTICWSPALASTVTSFLDAPVPQVK